MEKRLKEFRMIIVSTFLWGFFAHGMALFNKYSFHDDAGLFGLGQTYSVGRWMLAVLGNVIECVFGSAHYSTPLFHGILTILFVAFGSVLLIDLFEIKNRCLIIGLSGMMVVFPALASAFGYMFTAPYYFFGTLLGIFGCWLSCEYEKWYLYLAGLFLMGCAVGVYQANIPVYVSMILLYAIKKTAEKDSAQWKQFLRLGCKSVISCTGFMAVYLSLNQLALGITGMRLSDYQGINSYGRTSVRNYIKRILAAYREFFIPTEGYPFSTDVVYQTLLAVAGIATVCLLYRCLKKDRALCAQVLCLALFFPLAVNFIYFMCDPGQVDALMIYGKTIFFVYAVWIADSLVLPDIKIRDLAVETKRGLIGTLSFFLLLLNVMYCRLDNICYLKAEFMQAQAISYFTALSAQMKSVEGFTDQTPVVYINEYEKYDYTLANIPEFKEIGIVPYNHSRIINSYSWKITMKMWCNFDPICEDASGYSERADVMEMPSYPNAGSIKMMDGVLIVKF